MKLLLAPVNITYQELLPLIVCDINNKKYTVHRCPNCPKSNTLLQYSLFNTIGDFDDDDDDDDDDVTEFFLWATTGRYNFTHHKETVNEYVKTEVREKCPNTELFLVRIFLYSSRIRRDRSISPYSV